MTQDALCSSTVDLPPFLIYDTINATTLISTGGQQNQIIGHSSTFFFDNASGGIETGMVMPLLDDKANIEVNDVVMNGQGRNKRRRKVRSCKKKEDAESQRMAHIAVERNRRRQMNEYLAVLRSLMPESYVQRGDQASIVGGAIDFVKELEQMLQSLEAQKRTLMQQQQQQQQQHKCKAESMPIPITSIDSTSNSTSNSSVTEDPVYDTTSPPFAQFFSYPQYIWCHSPSDCALPTENHSAVADIQVNLIETHANVRILSPRRPGQLLKMLAGLQSLRLSVLHLNVTTLDTVVLYSLSLKVEEGCNLTTVDDIAAAAHHVLSIIEGEMNSRAQ